MRGRGQGWGWTTGRSGPARDTAFGPDNDPYGDHTFGTVTVRDTKLFWKIDLYDTGMVMGSPAPTDLTQTCRLLTVMLPSDW